MTLSICLVDFQHDTEATMSLYGNFWIISVGINRIKGFLKSTVILNLKVNNGFV